MSQEDIISKILPHADDHKISAANGNDISPKVPSVWRGFGAFVSLFFIFLIEWIFTGLLYQINRDSIFRFVWDGTFLTFLVAVYIAYRRILEVIASRKEAQIRATTQTSDLKDSPDGDIEIIATIKSINGISKSPIFNIQCLAAASSAKIEKRRGTGKNQQTLLFEKIQLCDELYLDDGTDTVFPPKLDLTEITMTFHEYIKPMRIVEILESDEFSDLNDDHFIKKAILEAHNHNLSTSLGQGRLLLQERIILASSEGMFNGRATTLLGNKTPENKKNYFPNKSDSFELHIGQDQKMFQNYVDWISSKKITANNNNNIVSGKILLPIRVSDEPEYTSIKPFLQFKSEQPHPTTRLFSSIFFLAGPGFWILFVLSRMTI
jgi:hypothetical protein